MNNTRYKLPKCLISGVGNKSNGSPDETEVTRDAKIHL